MKFRGCWGDATESEGAELGEKLVHGVGAREEGNWDRAESISDEVSQVKSLGADDVHSALRTRSHGLGSRRLYQISALPKSSHST